MAALAAPGAAQAQITNPLPIDWTIVQSYLGPGMREIPLRVGQSDAPGGGLFTQGFGERHIIQNHGEVPPVFDVQQTILDPSCTTDPVDFRVRCFNSETLLFVVYQPQVDARSGDNQPFGIITAFRQLPGCPPDGLATAGVTPLQDDCPRDPLPAGLDYTGATAARNGEPLHVSAFLHDNLGTQIPGRPVSFALGTGADQQTCSGTTDAAGIAGCAIDPVDQPPSSSLPLQINFAGDSGFTPASANVQVAVQSATEIAYTGDEFVANGTAAELRATLTDADRGGPVVDRTVTLTLGDDAPQVCSGTTDAAGVAACTVSVVDQPLTDDATVPVTASFAGDGAYLPSQAQAQVLLEHYTGAAYGVSGTVTPPPMPPVELSPRPDTGEVRTAQADQTNVPCLPEVDTPMLRVAELCVEVSTSLDPGTVTATSEVGTARVRIPGVGAVDISGLSVEATSTCTGAVGSTTVELTINNRVVEVGDGTGVVIDLPAPGATIVVNEQQPAGDGEGIAVTGLRITGTNGMAEVVLGYAESAAHHCAPR